MPHLWVRDESAAGDWLVTPLDGGAFALPAGAAQPRARRRPAEAARSTTALLLRSRLPDGETGLVMGVTAAGVLLNGEPLRTGIRVLADRDELHVDGVGRVFFSTERLARVEPCPGAEPAVRCVRCKQIIEPGTDAVRCPQCGVWYHQSDDLPCWTYTPHCVLCPQPTALETGYRWTPAEVGA
jgi:hypothetical protein